MSAGAFAAPRIGLATMLTILVASQLAAALALDHFGFFGLSANPLSLRKALGMMSLMLGIFLVRG